MVSLAFAPTWNSVGPVRDLFKRWIPPNVVSSPIRLISSHSAVTSCWIAWRSASEFVPLADWTASCRMRWYILVISSSAPSAVWQKDIPFWALRLPCSRPLICAVMRSEIWSPAASSFALLIRSPEAKRLKELSKPPVTLPRLRRALNDEMFVLRYRGILDS